MWRLSVLLLAALTPTHHDSQFSQTDLKSDMNWNIKQSGDFAAPSDHIM